MGRSLKLGTTYLVKILFECVVYVKNYVIHMCLFSTLCSTYFGWEEGPTGITVPSGILVLVVPHLK